ncbi:MAG TPA: Hsp20/alpha crystallin family protein [Mycoplasmatales bacterium]|jgi:HSP20 family protein|nr:Hsp20/alpha crystallin family protein [Mycoplasmatales bacterium]
MNKELKKRRKFLEIFSPISQLERSLFSDFFSDELLNYYNPKYNTEVSEDNDRYYILMELPGIRKEDIKLEASEGKINVEVEKKQISDNSKKVHYSELNYGYFSKSFDLGPFNFDEINADLNNGILTLEIPKSSRIKSSIISIN